MQSSLISKIEKARRYADERERRFHFQDFTIDIDGENEAHRVEYTSGRLKCACDFFGSWGTCSHTMAVERVLGGMLPKGMETAAVAYA